MVCLRVSHVAAARRARTRARAFSSTLAVSLRGPLRSHATSVSLVRRRGVKEALARVPGLQGVLSLGAAVLLQPGLLGLQSALNSELFLRAACQSRVMLQRQPCTGEGVPTLFCDACCCAAPCCVVRERTSSIRRKLSRGYFEIPYNVHPCMRLQMS